MESTEGGMESRPKGGEGRCSLTADAIRGQAAIPYNAFGVDAIPSPSVLDKNNGSRRAVIFWWTIKDSNLGPTGYEPVALTN